MTSTSIRRPRRPRGRRPRPRPVSVTACGAGNESDGGSGDGGGDAVTLDGGGATSQAKAQGVWRANYQNDSGNTVNYEEVGSGTGRENFNSGAYIFAGSDSYMNDDEGELSAAKEQCGSDPIEVPAYVSPIAVAFNVAGVDVAEPVGRDHRQHLQRHDHQVERRRDRRRQPRRGPARHGDHDHPPLRRLGHDDQLHRLPVQGQRRRLGDRGRRPVARGPDHRPGPRGHVRRHRWHHRHRRVRSGTPTTARSRTPTSASSRSGWATRFNAPTRRGCRDGRGQLAAGRGTHPTSTWRSTSTAPITDAGAYPLLLTSYLIACQTYDDEATADAVKGYLAYVVSTEGQQAAADEVGSAPLDASLQEEAAGIVDKIAAS